MKRNENLAVIITIVIAAIVFVAIWHAQSEPDYVQDAKTRVSSYLGNYYGPSDCSTRMIHDDRWKLICTISKKGSSLEFYVMPAENAPYPVSRSFYLKVADANSEESAQLGLMKYLQIDTNPKFNK
ncbi:hypothetical protein [Enterobacter asburiae]|uniref:hypothetical protein n=1 Tax=Enterobacter asburiae TaxID=61645 RepID=UPI0020031F67|nr:hypothetical protein [Enterobacter asburiae]MCK6990127.1 hypothetical protein [Enterobacter asburiae]